MYVYMAVYNSEELREFEEEQAQLEAEQAAAYEEGDEENWSAGFTEGQEGELTVRIRVYGCMYKCVCGESICMYACDVCFT